MGKMPGAKADAKADVVTSEETEKAEVAAQLTGEGRSQRGAGQRVEIYTPLKTKGRRAPK